MRIDELPARVSDKIIPEPMSGCWLWIGAVRCRGYGGDYGCLAFESKTWLSHRFVYSWFIGDIPDGLVIDHLCRNPGCCNPQHMEPVTRRENNRRGVGWPGKHSRTTHCPQGHPYVEGNIYWQRSGGRLCRTCTIEHSRRTVLKKREEKATVAR